VKLKVGRDLAQDVARVRAVREIVGGVPISVDANMAWSLAAARAAVDALRPYDIAWFEEPVAQRDWRALRALRRDTGARVMLDESLCTRDDAEQALAEEACDLFNLRVSKCGGLIACLRLAELAHRAGVGFQLGAQVGEMGPLWAAGRRFAASVRGACAYEAGQADRWFATQVVSPPHEVDRIRHLAADLPGAGLGVTPTAALARFTVASWRWGEHGFRAQAPDRQEHAT
jgi:L-alanine-DL-glutamate epimerase-like enolase superfamily enzyme